MYRNKKVNNEIEPKRRTVWQKDPKDCGWSDVRSSLRVEKETKLSGGLWSRRRGRGRLWRPQKEEQLYGNQEDKIAGASAVVTHFWMEESWVIREPGRCLWEWEGGWSGGKDCWVCGSEKLRGGLMEVLPTSIRLWKLSRMTAGLGVKKRMTWGQSVPWWWCETGNCVDDRHKMSGIAGWHKL